MKILVGLMVLLGTAAAPVFAQKVVLDYAHEYEFGSLETFQYVDSKESNIKDPLMAGRVVKAIKEELEARGLQEAQEDGDLLVTYHYSSRDGMVFQTTSMGMGMGRAGMGAGWGRWGGVGMGTATTTATTYTEGTLIIDGYDPEDETLVWRGSGTVTLKAKPEAQMKQVTKVLKKLGSRWDRVIAGKGK